MTEFSRRAFIKSATALTLGVPLSGCGEVVQQSEGPDASAPLDGGSGTPASDPPLEVAMLIYPGMTALDMIAPQLWFKSLGNARVHHVWKEIVPLECDSGISVLPNITFELCPKQLDILFVGGASRATWPLMNDPAVLTFLSERGASARFITSVCTGSMLLAAAGLLRGYRATGNWATRHLLDQLGASPVDARVVIDENRITGAGVTAGVDFAMHISQILRGSEFAQVQQLMFEYAPEPPFMSGSPETAPPAVLEKAQMNYAPIVEAAAEATAMARARLGV